MIRKATVEDLPGMMEGAREFSASSRFSGGFNEESFCSTWESFLTSGYGVIFVEDEGGSLSGAVGGAAYQDPNSGKMVATEFFWFVRPRHRHQGVTGMALYREFEKWAVAAGCHEIRMAALLDSMPEKLDVVYRRLGFVPVETVYVKRVRA